MNVRKKSLLCLTSSRPLSVASSIGLWRDDDSFFEDPDQKGSDTGEARSRQGSKSSNDCTSETIVPVWKKSSFSEISSIPHLSQEKHLLHDPLFDSGYHSDSRYSFRNGISTLSTTKIRHKSNLHESDWMNFQLPKNANESLSRERRNTYDLPYETKNPNEAIFRQRSLSGNDSSKLEHVETSTPIWNQALPARRNSFDYTASHCPCLDFESDEDDLHHETLLLLVTENPKDSRTQALLEKTLGGLRTGYKPWQVDGCSGGTYYLRDGRGRFAGIFKPEDEEASIPADFLGVLGGKDSSERGLRKGVKAGEGAAREVAAYALDHDTFAGVPVTALVQLFTTEFVANIMPQSPKHNQQHRISSFQRSRSADTKSSHLSNPWKTGSLQAYTSHDSTAEDVGFSLFPSEQVHRIGILDIRMLNTDRHCGNILLNFKNGIEDMKEMQLIPIDHGLCLPDVFKIDNDIHFAWMDWPQANEPFGQSEVEYIKGLDAEKDVALVQELLGRRIDEESLLTLHVGTLLLKKAVKHNLTLYEIGKIICGNGIAQLVESPDLESFAESPLNGLIRESSLDFSDKEVSSFIHRMSVKLDNHILQNKA